MSTGRFLKLSWSDEYIKQIIDSGVIVSGRSYLTYDSMLVENQFIYTDSDTIQNVATEPPPHHAPYAQSVQKTILIVLVSALDSSISSSLTNVSGKVFGTLDNSTSVASQFQACSFNQLNFVPFSADNVVDGVLEISLPITISGLPNYKVQDSVTEAIGGRPMYADYVIYCLPPGTTGDWIAYGYVNGWLSVYNDKWCNSLSAKMHEIGHNLGLAHSGENGNPYGDTSGYMGYSSGADHTPLMCYNAYDSWSLGWYNSKSLSLKAVARQSFNGDLAGAVDFLNSSVRTVLIQLITENGLYYYINYNKKSSFNSGTGIGINQVLVVSTIGNGTTYSQTWLVAKLSSGDEYSFENVTRDGSSMSIKVNSISPNGLANIQINPAPCNYDSDCGLLRFCNTETHKCIDVSKPSPLKPSPLTSNKNKYKTNWRCRGCIL